MEQRSTAWFAARVGKVTASRVADVIAKTKSGWGASRANYMAELIAERLTGTPAEGYMNGAMQWGIDTEEQARAAYEFYADCEVELVGFVDHPRIDMSGASPDGRVGGRGLLELKCPKTSTHIDTLLSGAIPKKYITQMQWQMACEEREWCDFGSFDPRLPEEMRLFVKRVERDDKLIKSLEEDVEEFIEELENRIIKLKQRAA